MGTLPSTPRGWIPSRIRGAILAELAGVPADAEGTGEVVSEHSLMLFGDSDGGYVHGSGESGERHLPSNTVCALLLLTT